jgi:hypothetical protein
MQKTSLFAAIALSLAVAAPTASFAIDDMFKSRLNVPADQWLPPFEIADKLSPQGYEVLEIDSDDGAYEGEMLDKNGVKVDTPYIPRRPSSCPITTTNTSE